MPGAILSRSFALARRLHHASVLAACLVAAGAAQAVAVSGTVDLVGAASSARSTIIATDYVAFEREREAGDALSGFSAQSGRVEVDWLAGTLRGRQRALDQHGPLGPLDTSVLAMARGALQVTALAPGMPATVMLELMMTVDALFDFPDLSPEPDQGGDNGLRALIQVSQLGGGFGSLVAQVEYLYAWALSHAFEDVRHDRGGFTFCAGCAWDIDVAGETRGGFQDAVLHLSIPMTVGSAYDFNFVVSGHNAVNDFGANGEWDHTARLSYVLPAGYVLVDDAGRDLGAWNQPASVPVPATLGLVAGALPLLWRRRRVLS